jgi:hypothetical protein
MRSRRSLRGTADRTPGGVLTAGDTGADRGAGERVRSEIVLVTHLDRLPLFRQVSRALWNQLPGLPPDVEFKETVGDYPGGFGTVYRFNPTVSYRPLDFAADRDYIAYGDFEDRRSRRAVALPTFLRR